ncbi:GNAT family N-acetyltransferase [Roseospira marina]|uniref:GNAT family N-acetyltransferase n=2 Tax=Roseospira marina TaxID=140057 RepID=A0A5M6I951_9PROT|nr:GNAT family N-acetyltransferase [Roseospira marina]
METLTLRPLRADDGDIAGAIFFDAVHRGAAAHYTPEQRIAWAGASPNTAGWRTMCVDVDGFMAERNGEPVGFMTLDANGYIDLAFVRSDVAGTGAGWRLYQAVEARAEDLGIARLTTDASLTARPFFERQGWTVEREQTVQKGAVALTNFKMAKRLARRP